jgi:hypothetical protein
LEQGEEFVCEDGGVTLTCLTDFWSWLISFWSFWNLALRTASLAARTRSFSGVREDVELQEGIEEFEGAAFIGAGVVVERLVGGRGGGGEVAEGLEGIADILVVVIRQRQRWFGGIGSAELAGGLDDGDFLDASGGFGCGTSHAEEAIAAAVADEGDAAAGAADIGTPDAGAEREVFHNAEFIGEFLAELAELHEQGETFVALGFLRGFVEEAEVVHLLIGRVDLAVLAEGAVEGLELEDGFLAQLDVVIDAGGRIEIVDECTLGASEPMRLTRPMRCMSRVEFQGVS